MERVVTDGAYSTECPLYSVHKTAGNGITCSTQIAPAPRSSLNFRKNGASGHRWSLWYWMSDIFCPKDSWEWNYLQYKDCPCPAPLYKLQKKWSERSQMEHIVLSVRYTLSKSKALHNKEISLFWRGYNKHYVLCKSEKQGLRVLGKWFYCNASWNCYFVFFPLKYWPMYMW